MIKSETLNERSSRVPSVKRTLSWIGHSSHSRLSLVVLAEIQNDVLS